MSRSRTLLVCALVLAAAAGVLLLVFATEPEARRAGATRETAMLVDVVEVHRGSFRPTVVAMGSVAPEQDVVLGPLVAGEVVERSRSFTPGAVVDRGEVLLRIDPADFENTLAQRRSELRQAEADLELEMGLQDVAEQDFELLGGSVAPENEALVLRRPQLDTARARVQSAQAAVRQAELDLERTTLRAPFDAHILSRTVDVGSQVAPGDGVGRLVGLDTYWVVTTVPPAKLRWISIPTAAGEEGSTAQLRDRAAWPEDVFRSGEVRQLLGALEDQTRMARLLVTVDDPLGRRVESGDAPPLIIGAFVEVRILAEEIPDVVRLSRDYLRKDDTVWVMEGDRLRIRDVDVVFRDATYAYVTDGLEDGDLVVKTNLATVVDGARLRLEGSSGEASATDGSG